MTQLDTFDLKVEFITLCVINFILYSGCWVKSNIAILFNLLSSHWNANLLIMLTTAKHVTVFYVHSKRYGTIYNFVLECTHNENLLSQYWTIFLMCFYDTDSNVIFSFRIKLIFGRNFEDIRFTRNQRWWKSISFSIFSYV